MEMTPHEEMKAHEKLCAERYTTIHKRLDGIEIILNKLVWGALYGFGGIVVAVIIHAVAMNSL
jgi:hypothetical protein